MVEQDTQNNPETDKLVLLISRFDEALELLERAPDFAKSGKLGRVFDTARRVLMVPGGCSQLEARAGALETAGVFIGSDWASPETLVPALTTHTLMGADAHACQQCKFAFFYAKRGRTGDSRTTGRATAQPATASCKLDWL